MIRALKTGTLLAAAALLGACGGTRPLEGAAPVERREADALWRAVDTARPAWNRLEARLKLDLEDESGRQGATAVLRMRRDTVVWLSVRKAGVEGARVLIRPDSVFVLDRTARSYTPLAYAQLTDALGAGLPFDRLQALFAGEALLDEPLRWSSGIQGGRYVLAGERDGLEHRLELEPGTLRLAREELAQPSTGRRLAVDLSAYEAAGGARWPMRRVLTLFGTAALPGLPSGTGPSAEGHTPPERPVLTLELELSRLEPDPGALSTDFAVNPRYALVPWE